MIGAGSGKMTDHRKGGGGGLLTTVNNIYLLTILCLSVSVNLFATAANTFLDHICFTLIGMMMGCSLSLSQGLLRGGVA